jgi:hypothetical protein
MGIRKGKLGMTLEEWLQIGVDKGFCTPVYCDNHNGVHEDNHEEWEERLREYKWERDFCWPVVRVYNGTAG